MIVLLFDDDKNTISAFHRMGTWEAHNNVDSASKGKWPGGFFSHMISFAIPKEIDRDGNDKSAKDGAFGKYFLAFTVPGRTGMGIHAGREGDKDGLGRSGAKHCTLGCIRMTNDGLADLYELLREKEVAGMAVVRQAD